MPKLKTMSALKQSLTMKRIVTVAPKSFGRPKLGTATYGIRRRKDRQLIWYRLTISLSKVGEHDEISRGSIHNDLLSYRQLDTLRLQAEAAIGPKKAQRAYRLALLFIPGLAAIHAEKITDRLRGLRPGRRHNR